MDIFKQEEDFYSFIESDKEEVEGIINSIDLHYKSFIREKNGKKRRFHKADKDLKKIQKTILKKILKDIPLPISMIGGVKGGSPKKIAGLLTNEKYIIVLDIKDFYPSIRERRVFKLFSSLGFSDKICKLLVTLTTRWGSLPQGVCTSTYIALLTLRSMEKRFGNLCAKQGFINFFYVDDIYFSGSKRIKNFVKLLCRIIESEGFKVKEGKKKIMSRKVRQEVTKLIINSGVPNVSKEKRKIIRAKINNFNKYDHMINKEEFLLKLNGEINYIKSVNRSAGEKLKAYYNEKILNSY